MKSTKNHDAVLAFIKANENSPFDSIKAGNPKISDILMKGIIKDLQEEGIITANTEDGGYVFTGGKQKIPSSLGAKGAQPAGKKKEEEELGPKTTYGSRNNDKYVFNGEKGLGKSRLVLAVIRQYVKDNPKTTLAKVQEVFDSKTIQPRFAVVEEISKAKAHIKNKRERHFFGDSNIIKIGDKKCVCTNQWSDSTLKPLLKISRDLGYKIQVVK